jgi:hypothetical protein
VRRAEATGGARLELRCAHNGLTNRVPYIGPRGSFKSDPNWQNAHLTNPAYLVVEGAEDRKHHRLDQGRYGVTVTVGPTYTTKVEEESDFLTQILGGDPALVTSFLDLVFKLRGYPELEARAKLLVPAPVQQAQQGGGGQAPLAAQNT